MITKKLAKDYKQKIVKMFRDKQRGVFICSKTSRDDLTITVYLVHSGSIKFSHIFLSIFILKVFDHNPTDGIKMRKILGTTRKEIVKIADHLDNA